MNACLVNGYRKTVVQIGNIRGALVTSGELRATVRRRLGRQPATRACPAPRSRRRPVFWGPDASAAMR